MPDSIAQDLFSTIITILKLYYIHKKNEMSNSSKDSSSESNELYDLIIDYELDTHVKEICFSACPIIFLGGETRTLDRGSKIGFHRGFWTSEDMRDYYDDKETQEYYGWKNPYDFSSWIYESTQEEIYKQFKYYLERGVEPSFVIETMRARSDDGWYPRRKALLEANFLTK